jgi:hypothetical protein
MVSRPPVFQAQRFFDPLNPPIPAIVPQIA